MDKIKMTILALIGAAASVCVQFFGGWDMALQTLLGFMVADYISGMVVAGVFKRSGKSESGAISSQAGLKGIFRKGGMLLVVYIAAQLDLLTGAQYIRDAAVIAFIVNETTSILENLGLMGVPLPEVLGKALDALKEKGDKQ